MSGAAVRWLCSFPRAGGIRFRLGRSGEDAVAEWIGLARLRASLADGSSELSVGPEFDRAVVETVLAVQVAALLGHLRGDISLHASSVARAGVAVAFLGDSCAGKSTIAAQLCAHAEIELLSDDSTALVFGNTQIEVAPTETGHSLREDVALRLGVDPRGKRKIRKGAIRFAEKSARLGALVVLTFDDSVEAPTLRRVNGLKAFSLLNRALVRFAIDDPRILRVELDRIGRVAEEIPFYELARSRDLSNLPMSAQEAMRLLRSMSGDPG